MQFNFSSTQLAELPKRAPLLPVTPPMLPQALLFACAPRCPCTPPNEMRGPEIVKLRTKSDFGPACVVKTSAIVFLPNACPSLSGDICSRSVWRNLLSIGKPQLPKLLTIAKKNVKSHPTSKPRSSSLNKKHLHSRITGLLSFQNLPCWCLPLLSTRRRGRRRRRRRRRRRSSSSSSSSNSTSTGSKSTSNNKVVLIMVVAIVVLVIEIKVVVL